MKHGPRGSRSGKGVGCVALGLFALVLAIVFVTAYGVGSTTANPRQAHHVRLSTDKVRQSRNTLDRCNQVRTDLKSGGVVTTAQAIAEVTAMKEEVAKTLALERERTSSARGLLQQCQDALEKLRTELFGDAGDNVTARLQELQAQQAQLVAAHAKLTQGDVSTVEVHRRSEIGALQAAMAQQMRDDLRKNTSLGHSADACARAAARYSVVFDLGSTGNRVHVYKYTVSPTAREEAPAAAGKARDVISEIDLVEELFELNHKALSKLPDPVKEAPEALRELFTKAQAFVPAELHGCTPVEFKATAGLRMLGAERAAEILAEIRRRYLTESFWMRGHTPVRILDGNEEGPLAWMTVNFLLGAFGGNTRTAANKSATPPSTVAVIDLGGGSTQIVFEPGADAFSAMHPQLKYSASLGSRHVRAYQHSYEGYGLHAATRALLFDVQGKRPQKPGAAPTTTTTTTAGPALGDDADDEHEDAVAAPPPVVPTLPPPVLDAGVVEAFPCFAFGHEDELGVRNVKTNEAGTAAVLPSLEACAGLFRDRLLRPAALPCAATNCGIAGVFQPTFANFTGDIYAFSFIFDLLEAANASLVPASAAVSKEKFEVTLKDIAAVAAGHCASFSLARIAAMKAKGGMGSLKPEYECMYYSYVYALLRDGYQVPEDRVLHVAKKIRGYETAWSLGASLISLA